MCKPGPGWDEKRQPLSAAPARCQRNERVSTVGLTCRQGALSWARPSARLAERVEEGPEERQCRGRGPHNVRKEEKESGDRARGKGGGGDGRAPS